MKKQERLFFIHTYTLFKKAKSILDKPYMRKVVSEYAEKNSISENQLYYYLEKWSKKGFYEWGITIAAGWFEFGRIPKAYLDLIESESET